MARMINVAAIQTSYGMDLAANIKKTEDFIRQAASQGAQVIKFAATGGVLSNVAGGLGRQMFDDEMKAIVETAHAFGRKATAHAHGKDGIMAALRAGVDSVEHATFTDPESLALFRETGAYLVPTMIAPEAAVQQARAGERPPAVLAKAEEAARIAFAEHVDQFAAPGVLEQVTAQLGGEQGGAPGIGGVEVVLFGQPLGDPAGVADLAVVFDQQDLGDASLNVHVHRVMVIRVPAPTVLSSSNSSTSRLAPVSPRPRPLPDVQPSVMASLMSAMPGPSSRKVRRTPTRVPSSISCQSMSPPPP